MKNRVASLTPAADTATAKADRGSAKSKRARRARLVLSWVKVADLLDDLLDDLDAAVAAGAVAPDEVGHARRVVVSATEEMIGARPRLKASR